MFPVPRAFARNQELAKMTFPRVSLFQSAMRMRLTYGTLPTREQFVQAFDDDLGLERHYHITNCPRVGTAEYSCAALWAELLKAEQEYCDGNQTPEDTRTDEQCFADANAAGEWAAAVLLTLGIEWV